MSLVNNHGIGQQAIHVGNAGPANIGGAPVQANQAGGIRRALSEIAHSVQSFFQGISTRYENWQEGRAVRSATAKADLAASNLITAMKSGNLGPASHADFEALMKSSTRANSGQPTALAQQLFQDKLAALPQDERTKACCNNFTALGTAMKAAADNRIDMQANLLHNLGQAGLGPGTPFDAAAAKTQARTEIDSFIDSAKNEARTIRLNDLQHFAKGVFTVAQDGQITGQINNGRLPDAFVSATSNNCPQPPQGTHHTPASYIEARSNQWLGTVNNPTDFPRHGSVPIYMGAVADFHRMDFNIPRQNAAPFRTKLPEGTDSQQIGPNVKASVTALRSFAGTDAATTVLSALMHQSEFKDVAHMFSGPNGETVNLLPIGSGFNTINVNLPNNAVQTFNNSGQVGEAKINLSRQGQDFKFDLTWDYLAARGTDAVSGFLVLDPSNIAGTPNPAQAAIPQNAVKIEFTASFVVSKQDADAGVLRIDPNTANFQQVISGKVGMPT